MPPSLRRARCSDSIPTPAMTARTGPAVVVARASAAHVLAAAFSHGWVMARVGWAPG